MALRRGERLGPYEIAGPLGSGGMGDVYKAVDRRLNRTVAIKLIGTHIPHDSDTRRRFTREAEAVATLAHPHICVLYDVGEHDGEQFLVLEYLEGETLAERLQRGPLPLDAALRTAREIAGALDAAHRRGVLHRDLKPSNIMLTRSGAKLLDFGVALLREDGGAGSPASDRTITAEATAEGRVLGTFGYMAPERLEGRPGDARSDIFSFGAVCYEMITGRRAFPGDTQSAIMSAVLGREPAQDERMPRRLGRLIHRCLAKDPDDRWQTARDLLEALSWSAEDATEPRGSPRGILHRSSVLALLGTLAVAIVLLLWWLQFYGAAARTPVVVLMDSTLPERIYDPGTRAEGGTNSDDITDALRDLPLELHKETTSAAWDREDQVLRQRPALIMMHLSSFAEPKGTREGPVQAHAVERTRGFLGFMGIGNPDTRFVVYTRGFATPAERDAWVAETARRFPALNGRVRMLHVPGGDQATFRDPATRELVRREVAVILGLDGAGR